MAEFDKEKKQKPESLDLDSLGSELDAADSAALKKNFEKSEIIIQKLSPLFEQENKHPDRQIVLAYMLYAIASEEEHDANSITEMLMEYQLTADECDFIQQLLGNEDLQQSFKEWAGDNYDSIVSKLDVASRLAYRNAQQVAYVRAHITGGQAKVDYRRAQVNTFDMPLKYLAKFIQEEMQELRDDSDAYVELFLGKMQFENATVEEYEAAFRNAGFSYEECEELYEFIEDRFKGTYQQYWENIKGGLTAAVNLEIALEEGFVDDDSVKESYQKNESERSSVTIYDLPELYSSKEIALTRAIKGNENDLAIKLIKEGVNLDFQDALGRTPLFYAVEKNNIPIITALLDQGANINMQDSHENTPLHFAVLNGSVEAISTLIERGADIEKKNILNETALQFAESLNDTDSAVELVEKGASIDVVSELFLLEIFKAATVQGNMQALRRMDFKNVISKQYDKTYDEMANKHFGFEEGDHKHVEVEYDPDPDVQPDQKFNKLGFRNQQGETLLHIAIKEKEYPIIGDLIKAGIDINSVDAMGNTALHVAAKANDSEAVNILFILGVNPSLSNFKGQSPLLLAAESGNAEVIKTFLEKGIDYRPALHKLAQQRNIKAIQTLLDVGVNIDAVNEQGTTALHIAVAAGNLELVSFLVNEGADVNKPDKNGTKPYGFIDYHNHAKAEEIAGFLKEKSAIFGKAENLKQDNIKPIQDNGIDIDMPDKNGITLLHNAVYYNNFDEVISLLGRGADVNAADINGDAPLHIAIERGSVELIERLLANGADVNLANNHGMTPLHFAVHFNKPDVVRVLLVNGAKIHAVDQNGKTPISYAVNNKDSATARVFSEVRSELNTAIKDNDVMTIASLLKYAQANRLPLLHKAAREGNIVSVNLLLNQGYKYSDRIGSNQITPLFLAVHYGHVNVVSRLLEVGADINAVSENGNTPLHYAAAQGKAEVVKLLLKKGADLYAKNREGRTPLVEAKKHSHETAIRGAISEIREEFHSALESFDEENLIGLITYAKVNKVAVLHYAAQYGNVETISFLLQQEFDINKTTTKSEDTPLHIAVINGHVNVVELLLEKGARVDLRNAQGNTPLDIAEQTGNIKLAKVIISSGQEISTNLSFSFIQKVLFSAIDNGETKVIDKLASFVAEQKIGLLHYAAKVGNVEAIKFLLSKKHDINATTAKDGNTPLHVAIQYGHDDVVKLLIEQGADLGIKNKQGSTPLDLAEKMENIASEEDKARRVEVKEMIQSSKLYAVTNPTTMNKKEMSPFEAAQLKGDVELAKRLLSEENKTYFTIERHFMMKLVSSAVENGEITVLKNLLVTAKSHKIDLLNIAVRQGHAKAVSEIAEAGENVNISVDDDKNTHLHLTLRRLNDTANKLKKNGHKLPKEGGEDQQERIAKLTETLEALVKSGADITQVNSHGVRPIDLIPDQKILLILMNCDEASKSETQESKPEKVDLDAYVIRLEKENRQSDPKYVIARHAQYLYQEGYPDKCKEYLTFYQDALSAQRNSTVATKVARQVQSLPFAKMLGLERSIDGETLLESFGIGKEVSKAQTASESQEAAEQTTSEIITMFGMFSDKPKPNEERPQADPENSSDHKPPLGSR